MQKLQEKDFVEAKIEIVLRSFFLLSNYEYYQEYFSNFMYAIYKKFFEILDTDELSNKILLIVN